MDQCDTCDGEDAAEVCPSPQPPHSSSPSRGCHDRQWNIPRLGQSSNQFLYLLSNGATISRLHLISQAAECRIFYIMSCLPQSETSPFPHPELLNQENFCFPFEYMSLLNDYLLSCGLIGWDNATGDVRSPPYGHSGSDEVPVASPSQLHFDVDSLFAQTDIDQQLPSLNIPEANPRYRALCKRHYSDWKSH
jgi:hypothetical protein